MPVVRTLLVTLLAIGITSLVQAEHRELDVNLGWTSLDAGGGDEFKSGKALALHYNYFLKHWLAADIGLYVSDKTLEQSRKDVVGDFRTSIQSQALLFGLKLRHKFSTPYEVYGRLGIQYWRTELEVEEFFGPGIPSGTDSANDTGLGYFVSIGGGYYVTEKIMVLLELRHMTQLDVFEGKSNFPFDLAINSFSFGLGYRF
jgi:opacity protein-like surface antigen